MTQCRKQVIITLSGYFLLDYVAPQYQYFFLAFMMFAYGILVLSNYFKHYNYLFFSFGESRLLVRYFRLGILGSKKRNEIIIPYNQFKKYEIKQAFFGWRKELILFQHANRKISKYAPISIKALSTEEQQKLETMLTKISA